MLHRHLNHEGYTAAAIDDVIERGSKQDWFELRRAALTDPSVAERLRRLCEERRSHPHAQRHHFWAHYARRYLT